MPKGYPKSGINKTKFQKGHKGYWFGKKMGVRSQEWKDKISESHKGEKNPGYVKTGDKSWHWIEDRTQLKKTDHRANTANWEWKRNCKKRDEHKCKIADSNCKGGLEVHHILPYIDFPELRYELNNGITLCHFHHPHKKDEVVRLTPYFQKLIWK